MAGRPRKKAAEVAALEDKTIELFVEVFIAMPKQWIEADMEIREGKRTGIRDPVGRLWLTAFAFSQQAVGAFENLGNAMRRKAGIDGPSMWAEARDGWLADNDGNAPESCETECEDDGDGEEVVG